MISQHPHNCFRFLVLSRHGDHEAGKVVRDDQDVLVAFRSLGEVDHEITVDPFERLEGGRITLERNGAGTMVRSFPEGAAAAVVVVGFDVGADTSPPVSGGHTGAHALGADVGHTFMEKAEGSWLENGWDDG